VFTGPISTDLLVPFEQQTWVITSYAVTFAAFLLFWGRVSDLYSAKPVFAYGFLSLGVLSLVISFLPDRYSFFVIRAISGIAGATLIPASFRLIVAVFEPHELGKAFTIYSSVGAIANSTGVIVAGFIEYIPQGESHQPVSIVDEADFQVVRCPLGDGSSELLLSSFSLLLSGRSSGSPSPEETMPTSRTRSNDSI
jgi:MFS family permease